MHSFGWVSHSVHTTLLVDWWARKSWSEGLLAAGTRAVNQSQDELRGALQDKFSKTDWTGWEWGRNKVVVITFDSGFTFRWTSSWIISIWNPTFLHKFISCFFCLRFFTNLSLEKQPAFCNINLSFASQESKQCICLYLHCTHWF